MLALKLGARVFWANRRRSLLAASVVSAGAGLALLLWGIAQDVENQILQRTLAQYTGHVQVVREDYRKSPRVADDLGSFSPPEGPEVVAWSTRTEAWGVAFSERSSTGALLLGLEPAETLVTLLPYPRGGAIVGAKLARRLGLGPGDTLYFLTQDARGSLAPDLFPIVGLYRGDERLEGFGVLAPAERVKSLVLAGPHRLVVRLKDPRKAEEFASRYNPGPGLEVVPWQEAYPLLKGVTELNAQFIEIFLLAFLVLSAGSVMLASLSSYEARLRELALIRALGGSSWTLAGSVLTEGALVAATGIAGGALLGLALALLLGKLGIDLGFAEEVLRKMAYPTVIRPRLGAEALKGFLESSASLFAAGLAGALYPALKALRLRPAEAMRR